MPLVIGLIKASLPSYFPERHGVFDAALAALEEIAGACGARIVEARAARNVHDAPEQHFEIDPQALVDAHRAARQGGLQVLGYYHSHPNGLARPSATDRAQAARDGSVWAIITADRITLWRSGDAGFEALPYEVAPR